MNGEATAGRGYCFAVLEFGEAFGLAKPVWLYISLFAVWSWERNLAVVDRGGFSHGQNIGDCRCGAKRIG